MILRGNFPIDRFKEIETPFYYYDMGLLRDTLECIKQATHQNPDFRIHYAVKANANPEILRTISRAGFGADCVSGPEIEAAVKTGFPPEKSQATCRL